MPDFAGEVSEWLKEHAWNACVRESVPWVRIPPSPPFINGCVTGKRALALLALCYQTGTAHAKWSSPHFDCSS